MKNGRQMKKWKPPGGKQKKKVEGANEVEQNGCPAPAPLIMNPLNLPQVIENIMKRVEDPMQLVQLRGMNHDWRDEANKRLRETVAFSMSSGEVDSWQQHDPEEEATFLEMMGTTGSASKQVFQKINVEDYDVLHTALFSKIGPQIKSLTAHIQENYQQQALRHLLIACENLEYLDLKMWTTWNGDRIPSNDFLGTFEPPATDRSFRKLKVLIVRIPAYYDSLKASQLSFLNALFSRAPNLEKLCLPAPADEIHQFAPAITSSILNHAASFKRLKMLGVGFQFDHQQELVQLLNTDGLRLVELRLNQMWNEAIELIGQYQPGVKFIQLSNRGIGLNVTNEINSAIRNYEINNGFRATEGFTIHLVNMSNERDDQFSFKVSRNSAGVLSAALDAFRCYPASAFDLRSVLDNHIQTQLEEGFPQDEERITNTLTYLDLGNIPCNTLVMDYLLQFRALKKLVVVPTNGAAYQAMWKAAPTVEDLRIYIHPRIFPGPRLESAITGLDMEHVQKFHGPEAKYWKYARLTSYGPPGAACICSLPKLRKFEMRNNLLQPIGLTPASLITCFWHNTGLQSIKIPFYGNLEWKTMLQIKRPALLLDFDVINYD